MTEIKYPQWETVRLHGNEYVVDQCGDCGVLYIVPLVVEKHHFAHGGFAHCSNGHTWGWREGAEERDAIRRERDRLKQENARLEEEKTMAWRTAEDQRKQCAAAEQKLKAAQTRLGAGVCPCCNRTVSQLARHMQSKHPEMPFVPATKAKRKSGTNA